MPVGLLGGLSWQDIEEYPQHVCGCLGLFSLVGAKQNAQSAAVLGLWVRPQIFHSIIKRLHGSSDASMLGC